MKNRFYYYQLLDEREEQLMNKAGAESLGIKAYQVKKRSDVVDILKKFE